MRYPEDPPWSPVDDPYHDPMASAVLFMSWLPALLCGVRVSVEPARYLWVGRDSVPVLLPVVHP